MTTIGMDSSLPQADRAFVMILALVEGVAFTPEQRQTLLDRLRQAKREGAVVTRFGKRVAQCRSRHPGIACRWTEQVKQSTLRDGTPRTYRHLKCLEATRVRDRKRQETRVDRHRARMCPRGACPHRFTDHEDGECFHTDANGEPDCDCTGGKR